MSPDFFVTYLPGRSQHDLAAWLTRWQRKYPKLTDWVEENIASTPTFYRLPRQHHKPLKSTDMLERLNEELRRRTRVVRIFPNAASCLRLTRALCVESFLHNLTNTTDLPL